jgi:hypothetical protein
MAVEGFIAEYNDHAFFGMLLVYWFTKGFLRFIGELGPKGLSETLVSPRKTSRIRKKGAALNAYSVKSSNF